MSAPAAEYDVAIAGAGVGGAACALALARAGRVRVLLLDARSGPGNLNRGDSQLPAVTALLDRWGALDLFRAAGARPLETMEVWCGGSRLIAAPLAGPGLAPYLVLAHPLIERTLVEAALATGRVEVRWRSRVAGLATGQGGRVAGVELSSGEVARARLVVGADGARSEVRRALGLSFPHAPYDHGYFGIEVDRPAGYRDAMRVELSPAGGVLVVPARDPARVGLGILVRAAEEPIFRCGSLAERVEAIRRRSPLLAGCRAHPEGSHLYRLARAHAARYVAPGAALIGDAAHVTNPTAGQGMTLAIEDAAALARHAAAPLVAGARGSVLDAALALYESERRPKNAAAIRWSHWLAQVYALGGVRGEALRGVLARLVASPLGRVLHRSVWRRIAARQAVRS